VGAKRNGGNGGTEQDVSQKRRSANDGHWISPCLIVPCWRRLARGLPRRTP
jgi:hypothetical protein